MDKCRLPTVIRFESRIACHFWQPGPSWWGPCTSVSRPWARPRWSCPPPCSHTQSCTCNTSCDALTLQPRVDTINNLTFRFENPKLQWQQTTTIIYLPEAGPSIWQYHPPLHFLSGPEQKIACDLIVMYTATQQGSPGQCQAPVGPVLDETEDWTPLDPGHREDCCLFLQ